MLKPWMLVEVKHEDYSHIGEVMSLPIPDGTIMVRLVPGHPGTLQELKISQLTALKNQTKRRWIHYAEVSGKGSFPVGMLSRDHASAVNFNLETLKIYDVLPKLLVAKVTETKLPNWNIERWESFGWTCKPIHTEKYLQV
jgi:hypothetical protein